CMNGKTQARFMGIRLFDIGHFMKAETMMPTLIQLKPAPAKNIIQPTKNKHSLEDLWQSGVNILFALAFTRFPKLKGAMTYSLVCLSISKKHLKLLYTISLVSLVPIPCLESLNFLKIPAL